MLLNIKTFHKEDIVFGGGLYCIIPKFAGKKHTYIDHHQQRHQTTPHQTTQKQKNTQHQTKKTSDHASSDNTDHAADHAASDHTEAKKHTAYTSYKI